MKHNTPFSSLPFPKKATVSGLIGLLLYTLFSFSEPLIHFGPGIRLPGSERPAILYSNQTRDDLTELYVQSIREAQHSVTLVIYALNDRHVIQALHEKSSAGIPVHIVCDAKASPGIRQKLPQATIVRRAGKGLTHQKILCIDDNRVILGSANLTTESLKMHGNLVVAMENRSLNRVLTAKIKSMDEQAGSIPLTCRNSTVGSQDVELWVLPDDPGAAQRMKELFRSAKKTIKVAMFTWTRPDFTQELIKAAHRGVKVEAVIDRSSGKGSGAKIVRMLADAGIPVSLHIGKGLLHHKFAYIDDSILVNGSANWTNSAFKFNDDCFIVMHALEPEQQEKMDRLWERIQKESAKVEPVTRS